MGNRAIKVFGHRGASAVFPENTMPAFVEIAKMGADGIELDVQRTLDGELVVVHDEELDRVALTKGTVAKMTWSQLQKINVAAFRGGHERMPLLREVLEFLQDNELELNIELKNSIEPYEGMEEQVVEMVYKYGLENRIIYSSFSAGSVQKMTTLVPPTQVAFLYEYGVLFPLRKALAMGVGGFHPYYLWAYMPRYISSCRRRGLKVRLWTVDKPKAIERMIARKPDAIMSDHPDRVLRVLGKKR